MRNNFFSTKNKTMLGVIASLLIISGITAARNWPVVKYEARLLNIKLFQSGQIAGGSITQLPAVYHRQEHSLSCEIASLKMALSVYGLDVPESELIQKLNFDSTPRSSNSWGDPYQGFVGSIDGKMLGDGYGVYWDPIAAVGNEYLKAEVKKFTAQDLARELADGRPVVSWGFSGRGKKVSWTTPDGKTISAINGEHARTIVGFTGSVDSPTSFIIMDPIYGKLHWRTKDLMNNWAPFGNMGVVIYPRLAHSRESGNLSRAY
ncbi:MAG: C39 family peptidase [Candidatus Doudnabacteria bacterium]|nr:C39 family peptidase [Candidatus Doudnabacteria bacterium]